MSINAAAARTLGYEPGELVGHNICELLAPEAGQDFARYIGRIIQQRAVSGQLSLLDRSGQEHIWKYQNVFHEASCQPAYIHSHARDITEQVRAETAMRESQARLGENPLALYYLGLAQARLKDPAARKNLQRAVELGLPPARAADAGKLLTELK